MRKNFATMTDLRQRLAKKRDTGLTYVSAIATREAGVVREKKVFRTC